MYGCRGVSLLIGSYVWDGFTFKYSYLLNGEEVEGFTELSGSEIDEFEKTGSSSVCYFVLTFNCRGEVDNIDFYSNKENAIKTTTKYLESL